MAYTRATMRQEVMNRLSVSGASAFYTDNVSTTNYLNGNLAQGYSWATGFKDWKFMERAVYVTAAGTAEYYDYPSSPYVFKTDGITRIEVDWGTSVGWKSYDKLKFQSYLDDKLEHQFEIAPIINQEIEKYYFSDYQRKFFLYPIPVNGQVIRIWAITRPEPLTTDSSTTIFGDNEPDGDEAVIKYAVSIALAKAGQKQEAEVEMSDAMNILNNIFVQYSRREGVSKMAQGQVPWVDYFQTSNQ